MTVKVIDGAFPFLFGGTFIEAYKKMINSDDYARISLPFRRDFH